MAKKMDSKECDMLDNVKFNVLRVSYVWFDNMIVSSN